MENKKLTRNDIITTDVVYTIFAILTGAFFIAIAFVAALIFVCCAIYLVKSFMVVNKFKAFVFTIMTLASDAIFVYIDVLIFKSVKESLTKYKQERREILQELEKENN